MNKAIHVLPLRENAPLTILRGPNNKDYGILGFILGSPYFGKLPYRTASCFGCQRMVTRSKCYSS